MTSKDKNNLALTGGHAVGRALQQIDPDVMAVYPITPQTPIVEFFAKSVANGEASTEIIAVESEHSALSACVGAQAAGARSATASSSQGILYMFEVLPVAASMRLPIVMAVSNRAISGPLNIHGDHSDAMMMRDVGWIQIFSENVQEAYDNMIIGQKLAEKAMLPLAVNLDGFVISHSVENLEILSEGKVQKFIGQYEPKQYLFDFENPVTFGPITLPDSYFEFRKQIYDAMEATREMFDEVAEEFEETSGRKYEKVEEYQTEDAEKVIVTMGATCGTIKEVVDRLREKGQKVGLLKIRLFRPFPCGEIAKAVGDKKEVIVMDKNLSFGTSQVLATEVAKAIKKEVKSIIFGLGGREATEKQIEDIFNGEVDRFLM